MSNGCGCEKGVLKYIKPPYAQKFYIPCCLHDDDYDRGGDKKARQYADRRLFQRCFKLILRQEQSSWRMVWLTLIALLYYCSVRLFGGMFYNYTNMEL